MLGAEVAAPHLEERHVANCKVVVDRVHLLDYLPKDAVLAEVGVLHGDFSEKILERTQPRELHLIDVYQRWGDRFRKHGSRVVEHIGDSVASLTSFPDGFFDWIYIDADHSYQSVKRDAEVACRKVNQDGLLVFNDYMTYDPISQTPYGVARAVHELCHEDNWQLVYLALQNLGFYDAALQRL